jgi:hypothetical protein
MDGLAIIEDFPGVPEGNFSQINGASKSHNERTPGTAFCERFNRSAALLGEFAPVFKAYPSYSYQMHSISELARNNRRSQKHLQICKLNVN